MNKCFLNFDNFSYFFLFQLFILIALNISALYKPKNLVSPIFQNNNELYPNFSPTYFCVIQVSRYNITRLDTEYSSWLRYIKYTNKNSVLKIYTTIKNKKYKPLLFSYGDSGYSQIFSLVFAFIDALRDFLHKTNLPWFLRTTDDVFIYFPNFAKLINLLEKKYDPYKDKVIKGHLCSNHYLHGGPGWLLSRAAAEKLYDKFTKFPITKVEGVIGDDVFLPGYFKTLNISLEQWNSRAFLASPFSNETRDRFINHNFDNLPECKANLMVRMKDVAVWHSGAQTLYQLLYGNEYMKIMPFNLYGSANNQGKLELCQNGKLNDPAFDESL